MLRIDTTALFARAVQVIFCDRNNDQKLDDLVCEFGNLTGGLGRIENTGENKYARHVLRSQSGAIKAYAEAFNPLSINSLHLLAETVECSFF